MDEYTDRARRAAADVMDALRLEKTRRSLMRPNPGFTNDECITVAAKALMPHLLGSAANGKRPMTKPTDEEWIVSLEKEPAMAGIDVRQQLGMAQVWCKTNRRECTRKFFVNWLNNPRIERKIAVSGAGQSSFAVKKPDLYTAPQGWQALLLSLGKRKGWDNTAVSEMSALNWLEVPITVREEILRAL